MANSRSAVLGANISATGSNVSFGGGKAAFIVDAAFGGGTVKLQLLLSTGNYADVTGASLTAAGMAVLDLPAGSYRVNVATATGVHASLVSI